MFPMLILLVAGLGGPSSTLVSTWGDVVRPPLTALVLHTYEARIRLDGRISTTQVRASDAAQAKRLVKAQFGGKATVLSVKRVN